MRILAVFLDKSGHTDFMGRRQSSDRAAIDRLVKYASGRTIFIRPYSEPLFSNCPDAHTLICSDFQSVTDGIFLAEGGQIVDQKSFDIIITFNWNRYYPGSQVFRVDGTLFNNTGHEDFRGSSHEKITMTIHERREK